MTTSYQLINVVSSHNVHGMIKVEADDSLTDAMRRCAGSTQ